jgi:hypothetical protein
MYWLFCFNIGLFAIFHLNSGDTIGNLIVSGLCFIGFIFLSFSLSYGAIKDIYNESFN